MYYEIIIAAWSADNKEADKLFSNYTVSANALIVPIGSFFSDIAYSCCHVFQERLSYILNRNLTVVEMRMCSQGVAC